MFSSKILTTQICSICIPVYGNCAHVFFVRFNPIHLADVSVFSQVWGNMSFIERCLDFWCAFIKSNVFLTCWLIGSVLNWGTGMCLEFSLGGYTEGGHLKFDRLKEIRLNLHELGWTDAFWWFQWSLMKETCHIVDTQAYIKLDGWCFGRYYTKYVSDYVFYTEV